MKIIISHDVDHIYTSDHYLKDLIIEKLLVRSFLHMLQKKISVKSFFSRVGFIFSNKMNNVSELAEYDKKHSIPSTFFFGMRNGLGMSYSNKSAKTYIDMVRNKGFDVGVHGIAYDDINLICREHDTFALLTSSTLFGIRNHYVRCNDDTFRSMAKAGYIFDSTDFNKERIELKAPYKVDGMWEFPLHIMDVYTCENGEAEAGIMKVIDAINEAESIGLEYCTILFHDYMYNEKTFPGMKRWYEAIVSYCEDKHYDFVSFRQAIKELEND